MNQPTLIAIQEKAVADIIALPEQGKRAAGFGATLLNRPGRRIRPILADFAEEAGKLGYGPDLMPQLIEDIKDMARLEAAAE